jgi:phospholipid/cholesterol/gamma-HCH transport system ATP-binding protein
VVSAELDELILRIKAATKVTIVVVTHELESAFKIADRITVLGDGQVLMTGTVDEVRSSDNEVIQDMLNRRPRDEAINAEEYLQRLTAARGNRYY